MLDGENRTTFVVSVGLMLLLYLILSLMLDSILSMKRKLDKTSEQVNSMMEKRSPQHRMSLPKGGEHAEAH
jgi:hypothetical protein